MRPAIAADELGCDAMRHLSSAIINAAARQRLCAGQETYSTRDETRHRNARTEQTTRCPPPQCQCRYAAWDPDRQLAQVAAVVHWWLLGDHHPLITLSRPAFCCAAPQSPVDLGRGARPQRGQQARGQTEGRETMTIKMIPNRHLTSAETISCHLPASCSPFGTLCSPAISPGRLWELRREAVAGWMLEKERQ